MKMLTNTTTIAPTTNKDLMNAPRGSSTVANPKSTKAISNTIKPLTGMNANKGVPPSTTANKKIPNATPAAPSKPTPPVPPSTKIETKLKTTPPIPPPQTKVEMKPKPIPPVPPPIKVDTKPGAGLTIKINTGTTTSAPTPGRSQGASSNRLPTNSSANSKLSTAQTGTAPSKPRTGPNAVAPVPPSTNTSSAPKSPVGKSAVIRSAPSNNKRPEAPVASRPSSAPPAISVSSKQAPDVATPLVPIPPAEPVKGIMIRADSVSPGRKKNVTFADQPKKLQKASSFTIKTTTTPRPGSILSSQMPPMAKSTPSTVPKKGTTAAPIPVKGAPVKSPPKPAPITTAIVQSKNTSNLQSKPVTMPIPSAITTAFPPRNTQPNGIEPNVKTLSPTKSNSPSKLTSPTAAAAKRNAPISPNSPKVLKGMKVNEVLTSTKLALDCCLLHNRIPLGLRVTIHHYWHLSLRNFSIYDAVKSWVSNEFPKSSPNSELLLMKYGHIRWWDTSKVTNMSRLFQNAIHFNEDIRYWDVSNVTDMRNMFDNSVIFNQPINTWNVSNVMKMDNMFQGAIAFNQSLDKWNVSNVFTMSGMFQDTNYNHSLVKWNVANVLDIDKMFTNNNAMDSNNKLIVQNSPWIEDLVFSASIDDHGGFDPNLMVVENEHDELL